MAYEDDIKKADEDLKRNLKLAEERGLDGSIFFHAYIWIIAKEDGQNINAVVQHFLSEGYRIDLEDLARNIIDFHQNEKLKDGEKYLLKLYKK